MKQRSTKLILILLYLNWSIFFSSTSANQSSQLEDELRHVDFSRPHGLTHIRVDFKLPTHIPDVINNQVRQEYYDRKKKRIQKPDEEGTKRRVAIQLKLFGNHYSETFEVIQNLRKNYYQNY